MCANSGDYIVVLCMHVYREYTQIRPCTCDSVTITHSVVNVVPGCVFHSIISYIYDCFKNVVEEITHPETDLVMLSKCV